MKDVNKIILIGRLGADPVHRETKSGTSVVQFSLATSRRYREQSEGGEETQTEETQWHKIVAWGKQGEACAQYLRKGQPVYVEGMVKSRKYEARDGSSRLSFEVHADSISFLGGGGGSAREALNEAAL